MSSPSLPPILPWDEHNQSLVSSVAPPDWTPPRPAEVYNLVVVGGGTAGLVTAAGAAGLGAKVALVERHFLGGDCLNTGCVPSKALLGAARAVDQVRNAAEWGIHFSGTPEVRFEEVMERMRRTRASISPHDSAARFQSLGVDVFFGEARFQSTDRLMVGESTELRFRKAVIATGARPTIPAIPGLDQVPFLTNETLFQLTALPKRLAVIGAGPIGCEMAQAFARFGSSVSLIETGHGILPREERDAAQAVQQRLERDGVRLFCCGKSLRITKGKDGSRIQLSSHEVEQDLVVDQILVATGRTPNVEGLGLENAGVEWNPKGVTVDDHLRTTQRTIFACGDVCSRFQFTHAADFMARIVLQNALFLGRAKASGLVIPWCTYTSPELARVGLSSKEAEERGIPITTYTHEMSKVDRAILEGETEGFVRVHLQRGKDRIVGATAVGSNAGEMISEITLAMRANLGLRTIGSTLHPYPTRSEAIRKLGDLYNRDRLTPGIKRWMNRWLSWQRG